MLFLLAAMFVSSAYCETRICQFTPAGGTAGEVAVTDWSATLNGKPRTLECGEHRCGRYVFSEGWIFHEIDPKEKNLAVMKGSFTVDKDGEFAAGMSGDYFYDLFLDGAKVYSTGTDGNGTCEYGFWNRTAKFPVKAGRHELKIELRNGCGPMMFAIGKPENPPVRGANPVTLEETLAAAGRVWEGDVYDRNNPKRLADLAVLQRAVDMTGGQDVGRWEREGKSDGLFRKAPALAVVNAGISRALKEIPATKVKPGSIAVWYFYDMGHIVKTPGGTVFAIDLSCPRDAELADLCDFALVTHAHEDHASPRVLKAMQKKGGFANGKPVVSTFLYSPYLCRLPKVYFFGDCVVETGISDHNPFWTQAMTPFKITCGTGPDAVSLLHHGDGYDASQLADFEHADVAIVHVWPWDGHNGEETAKVLKPDLLVLSHAQELTHGFGPGRWSWTDCESEAKRVPAPTKVICPIWGEKFVYEKPAREYAALDGTPLVLDDSKVVKTDVERDVKIGTSNVKCPAAWDKNFRHDWKFRSKLLFRQWREQNPDILGMQEPVHDYLLDIQKEFPEWTFAGVGRDDGKEGGEYSPIFWRKDRFDCVTNGTFWLSKEPAKPGSVYPGANHPRVCTFAYLKDARTGKTLACYNTHTSYVSNEICAEQIRMITGHMKANAPKDAVLTLTGDLNFQAVDPALKPAFDAGLVDADAVCETPLKGLWNSVTLYRFYPKSWPAEYVRRIGVQNLPGDLTKGVGARIDHILVSRNCRVKACGVDDFSPGGLYPSDHMPKFAVLEITSNDVNDEMFNRSEK